MHRWQWQARRARARAETGVIGVLGAAAGNLAQAFSGGASSPAAVCAFCHAFPACCSARQHTDCRDYYGCASSDDVFEEECSGGPKGIKAHPWRIWDWKDKAEAGSYLAGQGTYYKEYYGGFQCLSCAALREANKARVAAGKPPVRPCTAETEAKQVPPWVDPQLSGAEMTAIIQALNDQELEEFKRALGGPPAVTPEAAANLGGWALTAAGLGALGWFLFRR